MKVNIILFCILISINTFSQNHKFGKVSIEELEETVCSMDSTANATYLYKHRNTYYEYRKDDGFELITEVHERIKIYNQEGFDYATKKIRLYKTSTGTKEDLKSLKAYTYNLDGGKVVEVKLDKSGIFETEFNKYNDEIKFTMPNLRPGSVIEYKYKITSPFWSQVDEFVFQHSIPIKKLEARFEAPEYYSFKVKTKGFLTITPEKEFDRGIITFVDKTRNTGNGRSNASGTTFSKSEIEYSKHISKYNSENIPALKEEPYVNNINNYRASVKYELSHTNFPNSYTETYSSSWGDVVERIYKSSNFGDELKKTGYFKKDIDALVGSVSDPATKVELIYNFVKSQVKWNGYYGFYADDVRKAYKEHAGNSGDINLMLTAMLRYAGLNANPVLVSTRTHGIPLFPTREGYNYVVTWVELHNDSAVLLDATEQYAAPNILPYRALNWKGRIVADNGGSRLVDLYPKTKSKNSTIMMVKIDEEGTLEGNYRSSKTNHSALSFRAKYNDADKNEFLEKLENKNKGLEISDYNVNNSKDLSKPLVESYKFVNESQADIIGDKMYFSPLFHLKTNENPFKLEKREFPVDFGYPSVISHRVIINIPEGYKIENLPESATFGLPDNLGLFQFKVVGSGQKIQVSVVSQINQSIISPIQYEALKEYFNTFVQKETEQVVLTRI